MIYFKNRIEWRKWLKDNHSAKEIWLIYYKKHTKTKSISYNEAVEEALCYGWIDSIVKRIDDERYCQKFTPRKTNSKWSVSNKLRVEKLIKSKKMTIYGLEKIKTAKQNGNWLIESKNVTNYEMPIEFSIELKNNANAESFYLSLTSSQKNQFIMWISTAKKTETRKKRSDKAITLLVNKEKLSLK